MSQEGALDGRVGYVLKQVDARLRSRMEEALRPLGMTISQYACLEVLHQHESQSSAELARASFISRQSMNVMLKTMSRNGWVEPSPEPATGRARPYRITVQGEKDLAPAREAVLVVEERMIAGMSRHDHDALLDLLAGCLRRLE